ncbi:hypothetical protein PR202_gb22481 [Eleusine coracana subsp. coracana]|uniref:Uncharacterized protein n=1 Tax=Eleusine coracana subsp. coracana TaxID=191504 RepID=A0AAV5FDQ6_ELECO|nr:hypothetical protein QOZ80_6AG0536700 [Eleusine coracana subsp. coracana]GJN33854.1 hypothetical protein PR202_gb22481 [Eleusine coracana subsp. coracana]
MVGGTPRNSIGHILPGLGFVAVGLWHLFNHIRLFSLQPDTYVAPVWFPAPRVRHLELILVIAGSAVEFALEMFIDHSTFLPFAADGSIPSDRLHNHEHALICLSLLIYAASALHLDRVRARARRAAGLLLVAAVFAQELLAFHFHSTGDHAGLEGHFHWLLQLVVAACLATALLGVAFPRSFAVSLVRSACVAFHGVWLVVIGEMVWVPSRVPKGCELVREDGRDTVPCHGKASLHRAKALANIQFGWWLSFMTVFVVVLYLRVSKMYPAEAPYVRVPEVAGEEDEQQLQEAKCGGRHGFTSLEIEGSKPIQHVLHSPACRHGGEAIDRRDAPPPPPDAAAEKDEVSQGLRLPEDIRWERLDKARFFVVGAGLFSAVSAALYPAVVLKTRLQVAPVAASAGTALPPSAVAAAAAILRHEGPLAFYRGFATSLAGTVPARALYMGALEATRSAVGPAALNLGAPEPAASAAAGAVAGLAAAVAAQVVWTPVDVISQRLMVQGNPCPASRYRGGLDAFRKILASEGIRGLYRGFGMSILTYAPSNAVWWATYSLSQKIIWSGIGCYLCEYGVGVQEIDLGDGDSSLQPGYKTVMVVQGVSAAMAGGATALVTMPLDTIKTRMQVMDGDGEPITIGRTVRRLIREGGWGACYRGLGPRWASMSLSATTMITTYEFLKRLSAKGQESGLE